MAKVKRSLKGICREVGVSHLQVTEVLRRIDQYVREDEEVITQEVGTFFLKKAKARNRKLDGVTYAVPARNSVALRGKRFQGRAVRVQYRAGITMPGGAIFVKTGVLNSGTENLIDLEIDWTSVFPWGEADWTGRFIGAVNEFETEAQTLSYVFEYETSLTISAIRLGDPSDTINPSVADSSLPVREFVKVNAGDVFTREGEVETSPVTPNVAGIQLLEIRDSIVSSRQLNFLAEVVFGDPTFPDTI